MTKNNKPRQSVKSSWFWRLLWIPPPRPVFPQHLVSPAFTTIDTLPTCMLARQLLVNSPLYQAHERHCLGKHISNHSQSKTKDDKLLAKCLMPSNSYSFRSEMNLFYSKVIVRHYLAKLKKEAERCIKLKRIQSLFIWRNAYKFKISVCGFRWKVGKRFSFYSSSTEGRDGWKVAYYHFNYDVCLSATINTVGKKRETLCIKNKYQY